MEEQEVVCCSIFNYYEYFQKQFLTDCELHMHAEQGGPVTEVIRAHKIILSNTSDFFHDAFTSGMQETVSGEVDIYDNPKNLLPKVIQWMYSGKLNFTLSDFIPLIHISHTYGIAGLERELISFLDNNINSSQILPLVNQCYDLQLPNELIILETYIAKFLEELSTQELSDALDVATFARIVNKTDLDTEARIVKLNEFLGDWDPSDSEREALFSILGNDFNQLRTLVRKYKINWLPQKFLNTCK
ncbi:BTB/POZ domain containing protein [Tritrichomonas foetus]|uniref:BTB/POZ domain containing protein n=1 Tax=Tritrichomonas foetus TaxID=1144522 RepID=A0A1J4KUU9_9EUKA|nr:BTB/POZ domain containing protein [Tritrichomonas foetus]|eukprot:OHT14890.1 BTB/POZ domain containing protein [Tritrichomonas foetus]